MKRRTQDIDLRPTLARITTLALIATSTSGCIRLTGQVYDESSTEILDRKDREESADYRSVTTISARSTDSTVFFAAQANKECKVRKISTITEQTTVSRELNKPMFYGELAATGLSLGAGAVLFAMGQSAINEAESFEVGTSAQEEAYDQGLVRRSISIPILAVGVGFGISTLVDHMARGSKTLEPTTREEDSGEQIVNCGVEQPKSVPVVLKSAAPDSPKQASLVIKAGSQDELAVKSALDRLPYANPWARVTCDNCQDTDVVLSPALATAIIRRDGLTPGVLSQLAEAEPIETLNLLEKACLDEQDPNACHAAAVILKERPVLTDAAARATAAAELGCKKRNEGACIVRGQLLWEDAELSTDGLKAARRYFKGACNAKMPLVCRYKDAINREVACLSDKTITDKTITKCISAAGEFSSRETAVTYSPRRFNAYTARACEGGDARSCHRLAGLLKDGIGAPKDATRASQLYEERCAYDWENPNLTPLGKESCNTLLDAYHTGSWIGADEKKVLQFASVLCDSYEDGKGCFIASVFMLRGANGERNAKLGMQMMDKACALDQQYACVVGSQAFYLAEPCEDGIENSCKDLDKVLEKVDPWNPPAEEPEPETPENPDGFSELPPEDEDAPADVEPAAGGAPSADAPTE